ncbi:MAG: PBSX family phage terminase large subunit [Methanoregula sp.]|nr:PBSX family phage terminase large subunit [Methanoregula sp.]
MKDKIYYDFTVNADKIFNPLFQKLQKANTRFVLSYGGSGSSKSWTQTQYEIIRALQSKETILVCRRYASTLKHSVIALFSRILADWQFRDLYTENKSDKVFFFVNGSQIIFKGMDDTEKIKSIAGITRIWMEEANEFSQDDFNQLNLRLRGRDNLQLTMTFNPIDENLWINKLFFLSGQYTDQTTIIKTTYKDNRFIDDIYKQELERYQRIDPNYHRIYARGEWGIIDEARIFRTWEFSEFPERDARVIVYGLDFGYSQDPTAVVRVAVWDNCIYIDEVLYQIGLTNADIARLIKQDGYHGEPVACDSAEPKSIQDLRNFGIQALSADKGKGSINAGIDNLKRNTVYISPRSRNIQRENLHYKWKKDKLGNFLPVPEDANCHLIDSIRYSLSLGLHNRASVSLDGVFF